MFQVLHATEPRSTASEEPWAGLDRQSVVDREEMDAAGRGQQENHRLKH